MFYVTEVKTFINGVLNSQGREPVEIPDYIDINDPVVASGWVSLPEEEDGTRLEILVGNGVLQRLEK
jgi:hypothetical protein